MPANLQTDSGPSVAELVSGIVHDAQNLVGQQLALFKQEVREDFQKTRDAAVSLVLAAGLLLVGAILLCLMFVYLLHEVANWPLWVSFLTVGGVLTVIGGVMAFIGREQIKTVNPVPEQTAKALEENLEWKTKPT